MTEKERELVNCEGLHDADWHLVTWQRPRPSWDHDHCRICLRRIAEIEYGDPDAIQEAYEHVYPPQPGDEEKRNEWLCRDCFEKYKREFNWRAVNSR